MTIDYKNITKEQAVEIVDNFLKSLQPKKEITLGHIIDEEMNLEEDSEFIPKDQLLEYAGGGFKVGAKYIQRLGSPGHYIYVYANNKMGGKTQTMRAMMAYARHMRGFTKFFDSLKAKFDPKSFSVKPGKKDWNNILVNMTMRHGGTLEMFINLKSTKVLSYRRSKLGTGLTGAPTKMSKLKKTGKLKFKGIS